MIVKLLTEHHLECLSLKGGCRGSYESTHVKMPHSWKSHALETYFFFQDILHNRSIRLEKEFRLSLINDIVQVILLQGHIFEKLLLA